MSRGPARAGEGARRRRLHRALRDRLARPIGEGKGVGGWVGEGERSQFVKLWPTFGQHLATSNILFDISQHFTTSRNLDIQFDQHLSS